MFRKLSRAFARQPRQPEAPAAYDSGQWDKLSTQELQRRLFYERLARNQRLSEVEDAQQRKF
jgi:hypothetical protein